MIKTFKLKIRFHREKKKERKKERKKIEHQLKSKLA